MIWKVINFLVISTLRIVIGGPLLICVIILLFVAYDSVDLFFSQHFRFERYSNEKKFQEGLQSRFLGKDSKSIIGELENLGAKCSGPYQNDKLGYQSKQDVEYYFGCTYNSRIIGINGFYVYRVYFDFDKNNKCNYVWAVEAHRIYI
jgi:hypothetical protein